MKSANPAGSQKPRRRIPSDKSVEMIRALATEAIAAGARPQRVYRALARRWRLHVRTVTRYVYAERRVPNGDLVDVQPSRHQECAHQGALATSCFANRESVRVGPLSSTVPFGSNIARDPASITRGAPGEGDDGSDEATDPANLADNREP